MRTMTRKACIVVVLRTLLTSLVAVRALEDEFDEYGSAAGARAEKGGTADEAVSVILSIFVKGCDLHIYYPFFQINSQRRRRSAGRKSAYRSF